MSTPDAATARLLVTCPDQPGIISAVSTFFYNHGANITDLDQHSSDTQDGTFFLRLEFQTPDLDCSRDALENNFRKRVAERYGMQWHISYAAEKKRMAILVSRHDHVLMDLLWRVSRDDLSADITMVISNHDDLRAEVERFDIPYHHIPVTRENKAEAEAQALALLEGQVDVIVLARYMQILSPEFVARHPHRIINIHHSFLPAFVGANPYQQAWDRGVKLIGATSHYVTEELDQGPIIEQNVQRVSHRHSASELRALGQDVERQVMQRAVRWHLEDRVIVDGNKTVVFVK
ncbi:formyltetrahydrofolate deformylase [Alloalcanivorax xenomutans]|jgi:formyltetrahydrofolate deformylase|uniref:Formyltetrahydrofolate deformylase n=1 Tax=Alloalcanivorax xenomutans TaxID=1094342 RepID=A0A9Q3W4J2_9GAMM|nr:formyltetrahydrofolate deformylase [Alloalcanivorax xenomutans]ERS14418.1 formyltetrahydrofolate deformylase [Alcanivorax sp. PN-3]KYZ86453.1 formyltetrahydrofolate deformylase [Alcanivorax sp. KX64203]MBA4720668.1 formyltetrahydrofolate deformylase [Alcanivorax sp.]ARB46266.1 formyltetrahydrofolate deformylase [Alloalcanivorax xenomutans]MCE7507938.1 formyltetrahydrofolate deformylase [Alloalcanivorax xenomutans]